MRLPKLSWCPLAAFIIAPTYGQITVIETVTVDSNSTITITGSQGQNGGCCWPLNLPLCKDARTMFPPFPLTSIMSNTSVASPSLSQSPQGSTSTTTTLGDEIPTGTPRGFLITGTIPGDSRKYYFSYTATNNEVVLIPQTWQNATRWFLHRGSLRDHNPPYRFVWLTPSFSSSAEKRGIQVKRQKNYIYDVNRSHNYGEATENPLQSLRKISDGYYIRSSVDTTLYLRSDGISYSFAARRQAVDSMHDVIAIRSEDVGELSDEYVLINLEAELEPLPVSTSTTSATKTTGTGVSSISGYHGTSTGDGVLYFQTEPINLGTPPPIYLQPIAPYAGIVDANSPDTLRPEKEAKLFFGAPNNNGARILGNLNATLIYSSVVLDNSAFVVSAVCANNNAMTVTWTADGRSAWQVAKDTWAKPLILTSSSNSCPRVNATDTHSYLSVDSIQFSESGGLTAVATGSFAALGDVIHSFVVEIGPAPPNVLTENYVPNIGTPNSGDTGLKFAAMGQDFNQRLNAEIGFYDVSTSAGMTSLMEALYPPPSTSRRRRLEERGLFSALANAAKSIAKAVGEQILVTVVSIIQMFTDIDGTMQFQTFFTPTGNGTSSFDERTSTACTCYVKKLGPWGCQFRMWMYLPNTVSTAYAQMSDQISKWGNQLIGKTTYATPGLEIYCVDCFVKTDLAIYAKARSDNSRIVEAHGTLSGGLKLQIQFGINGYWEIIWNGSSPITTIGLGPIGIGKILQIGPYVNIDLKNELKLAFVGQLLVGFSADWPSLNGRMDFIDNTTSSNSLAGLSDPVITKILQVYGSVTLTWTVGIPISVALGVKVDLSIFKLEKDVAFVATPQVVVVATFQVPTSGGRRDLEEDSLMPRFENTDLTERQVSEEKYCMGAWIYSYAQILFEFKFDEIATLPLFSWPSMENPFYINKPMCYGTMLDVPMCQKSAVVALRADPTREAFCSQLFGWTTTQVTSTTSTTSPTQIGSVTVTSTTTATTTSTVRNSVTATSWTYTRTQTYSVTKWTSAACTGTASSVSLASRGPPAALITDPGFEPPQDLGPLEIDPRGRARDAKAVREEDTDVVDQALENRGLAIPTYFSGWNQTWLTSACGCILIVSPATKVIYKTETAQTVTTTTYTTKWVTATVTPTTTLNVTVSTIMSSITTKRQTNILSGFQTQSFPASQYSAGTYTATGVWTQPFVNYNLEVSGLDLGNCTCQAGQNCTWIDSWNNYNQTQTCSSLNDCDEFCAGLNSGYGDMFCVAAVYIPSRNMCVFKATIAGLKTPGIGGCGEEKSIAGSAVLSGLVNYPLWDEWSYDLNTNNTGLQFYRLTRSSDFVRTWYYNDGRVITQNWNRTVTTGGRRYRWLEGEELPAHPYRWKDSNEDKLREEDAEADGRIADFWIDI
ncbi:hypothetical protein TWF281_004708 [Arthrobotrys megalospora]